VDYYGLNPNKILDLKGVIDKNIQPFKLSDFKNKYRVIIQKYEDAIKENKAKMIDISDNLCWNDTCHVISPTGYGIYTDDDHYGKFYSRHWLSSLDYLTEF